MREVAAALTGQYPSFEQPLVHTVVFSATAYNEKFPPPLSILSINMC